MVPTLCVITVDGFVLFYDQDLKGDNFEEPI